MRTDTALSQRWQYAAYAGLTLGLLGLAAILLPGAKADFRRYVGGVNPVALVLGTSMVGGIALAYLRKADGFEILLGRATLRGLAVSAVLASVMAIAVIVADLILRYPIDINVLWPKAWLFYPAIGFVAEILFHVLPLALLMLIFSLLIPHWEKDRIGWIVIVLVAALEPIFQVTFDRGPIDRLDAYTAVHVFIFALLQLWIFRRYDFFTMYGFRLCYYAYWHLLWGALRLEWLF